MSTLALSAILLCLASGFGLLNHHFLRLPGSIGLTVVALLASMIVIGINALMPALDLRTTIQNVLGIKDLPETLLNGALCFLLFAGTLQVDVSALWSRKITVFLLATFGVVMASALFGLGIHLILSFCGIDMPLAWAFVLGAILAPTDPVAVAATLARVGLPKRLQAVMAGESLFNDGVGVVIFHSAVAIAVGSAEISITSVGLEFLQELVGGILVGGVTGFIAYLAMKRIDEYPLEIMISLALATSAYVLANALHASGPIAVVTAGLLIGGRGRERAMSEETRRNLALFWSVVDEILNALLFLLIGFEILGLGPLRPAMYVVMLLAIPLSLAVRAVSIVATVFWMHARNPQRWSTVAVLTWGGVRGGISVALALSITDPAWKSEILAICYAVVVFTIIVQGLGLERIINRLGLREPPPPA